MHSGHLFLDRPLVLRRRFLPLGKLRWSTSGRPKYLLLCWQADRFAAPRLPVLVLIGSCT